MIYTGCGSWMILDLPGRVLILSLIFYGSAAYCTNAGYTAVPVWCPDLSPCSGDSVPGTPAMVSVLLIFLGMVAEFQSAKIKCYRNRIFAHVNAYNAHRATKTMQDI